jgi:hypothetical protein
MLGQRCNSDSNGLFRLAKQDTSSNHRDAVVGKSFSLSQSKRGL